MNYHRCLPALIALGLTAHPVTAQVPVPQPTFTSGQLYQPLRTFTSTEIGIAPTYAIMHKGYLMIAGGRNGSSDPTGYARFTTWRLSQAAAPGTFNPSVVGTHQNENLFKTHNMGFSGDLCQARAGKFTIYNVANPAAPSVTVQGSGGRSSSHSSCWAGKYLYTGGEGYGTSSGWIDIFDVSNPAAPVLRRSVDIPTITGFRCASVYVLGNLLVVSASLTNGVATFDLSDPTNPLLISVFRGDTAANTYTSYLSGHRLYGGGQAGGLYIYDLQNPENIQLVDRVTTLGGAPRYPVLQNEYVHLGNVGNGRYQKIRVDTVPAQVVADVALPARIESGGPTPKPEVAIPIGNLVFVGNVNGSNTGTSVNNSAGWILAHDTAPDTSGPAVNAVRPMDGEVNVAQTSLVGVSFDEPLDGPSVSTTNLEVRPVGGSPLAGVWAHQGGIANFQANGGLAANTTYEVVVKAGGVKDSQGNGTPVERVFRFSTGASVSTIQAGLALHYPLDATSGTVAADAAGSNAGTLTSFPATPWIPGVVGRGALAFDGVDDHVLTGSMDVGNQFSFATWVRIPSGTATLRTVVGNAAGGFSTPGFKIFVYGSTSTTPGRVQLETGNPAGTAGNAANTATGVFPYDQWVHLAVTVNRSAGTARLWVNGVDRTADGSILTDFPTAGALYVGRMVNSNNLLGSLDDFRFYTRQIGAADVEQLRARSDVPLVHYRMNSNANDSGPNGRNATVTAGTFDTASAQEGAASLNLTAASSHAATPALEPGASFTASMWVFKASGTGGLATLASNSAAGSATDGWRWFLRGSTNTNPGQIVFETGNGTAGSTAFTAANAFPFNQWTHVAVGVDRAGGVARIYVNGVDVTVDDSISLDFRTSGSVELGRMGGAGSNYLGGRMDDVRMYQSWLPDHEIAVLAAGKLLTHWKFEGTGADESGFGRSATLLNGATYFGSGARGVDSLRTDGVNNGADDHAETAAFDLGNQFSLSLWAWGSTASNIRTFLANSAGGSATNGFRFFVNSYNTTNGAILLETGNGTVSNTASAPAGTWVTGQWNHVALVVDRAAGTAEIYLNRRKVTTDNTITTDFANNALLKIGRFVSGFTWDGQLDDVRIYGEKLSDGDIAALGAGSPNVQPTLTNLVSSASAATTGSAATFAATASDPNLGDTLQYLFDFGDGTSTAWTTSATATHTYFAPGRYVVTVFVSDGSTTLSRTMTQIIYDPPTASAPSVSGEMAYDATNGKVWCVVPDGNGSPAQGIVAAVSASTNLVVHRVNLGIDAEPVALAMRPGNGEVWVACKRTGEVKVVTASTGVVAATIAVGRGSMPVGVCFAPDGSAAFVACEGLEGVVKYNPATRLRTGAVDTFAAPRGIACTVDSARLLVARFRSPNNRGEVWEYAPASIVETANATPVRTFAINADTTTVDSPSAARGLANYLSQVVISPAGKTAWIPGKKDNIFRGNSRDGNPLTHETAVRSFLTRLDLVANNESAANRVDLDNSGLIVAACFSPRGDLIFNAQIGNETVAVVDANTRSTLPGIFTGTGDPETAVGFAPSGLCVSPDGSRLYVHNFLERTVRVFNISALTGGTGSSATLVATVALTTTEPLSTTVLRGKRLFYNSTDPRLALDGYIACASCHLGGDQDGRVWDITQFGEGLRNTIDLRGHGGMAQGALHWSANFNEVQDFENQIRDLSGGTGLISGGAPNPPLGAANAGRSTDLDALAAYVSSLSVHPVSPYRQSNGTFTASAQNGSAHFVSKGCNSCHSGAQFTDSNATTFLLHNIGTQNTSSGQRLGATLNGIDTPTLRGIWGTAPFLHRGQAADLPAIFNTTNAPGTTNHARFRELNATQQAELLDYLLQLE